MLNMSCICLHCVTLAQDQWQRRNQERGVGDKQEQSMEIANKEACFRLLQANSFEGIAAWATMVHITLTAKYKQARQGCYAIANVCSCLCMQASFPHADEHSISV